jgi:hypothetical protein
MITNRELTMDDYLAMLRRRLKVILSSGAVRAAGGISGFLHLHDEVDFAGSDPGGESESVGENGGTGSHRRSDGARGHAAAGNVEPEQYAAPGGEAISRQERRGTRRDHGRHSHESKGRAGDHRPVGNRHRHSQSDEAGHQSGAGFLSGVHRQDSARSTTDLQRADLDSCGCEPEVGAGLGQGHQRRAERGTGRRQDSLDDMDSKAGGVQEAVRGTASRRSKKTT